MSKQQKVPLVVDLDGTLLKTDLLFETANRFLTRYPLKLFKLLAWIIRGKSHLKEKLSDHTEIDASVLPYNRVLLDWLHEQKKSGRQLVLATASHASLAHAVEEHLKIFDNVLATEGKINLKGEHKSKELIKQFGCQGFDYVGNDDADFPVWKSSRHSYVVNSSSRFVEQAKKIGDVKNVFEGKKPLLPCLFRAMRPYQWVKNFLVFAPLLFSQAYDDLQKIMLALVAFLIFSMTASSVYLLNDLVDLEDDRHHKRKRFRPLASGDLPLSSAWLVWPLLVLGAFALGSMVLPKAFMAILFSYFALTLSYSLYLKQKAVLDVLLLAGLYTLRIIAGSAAIGVPLSFWLLALSMFIFLSLAFVKRFSELKAASHTNKLRGRGYEGEDLNVALTMGISSGYLSVFVLALYIQDDRTTVFYQTPEFIWLACPLLLYWISRVWLIAHRGNMHDDPIVFALRDRASWILGLCFIIVFYLAGTAL